MVGPDRQLAVAAVHQHRQPDRPRPAEVAQRVQGRPHRTAGVEHVVNQHHHSVVELAGNVGVTYRAGRLPAQVVAVHGHIERADRDLGALHFRHCGRESLGQRDAPGGDAQQHQTRCAAIRLEDLVCHAGAGPGDLIGVQHQPAGIGRRLGGGRCAGWIG